jgi:hypothetical protein
MTATTSPHGMDRSGVDQVHTLPFKVTLAGQAAAGLVFGLAPLLATAASASAIGFPGANEIIYRLGGAATFGYAVVALIALARFVCWQQMRIPAIATLTFTITAFLASAVELIGDATQPIVPFVVGAGLVFSAIAAYWLRRDEGPVMDAGQPLDAAARVILGLATLSAGTFGLLPLLAPAPFASLFGLVASDPWVVRLAGAACLGYATAGIASLMAPGYRIIRIQNLAAISFNALAAISAWIAVVGGGGGWLAPIVAAAASFFTVALIWVDRRYAPAR